MDRKEFLQLSVLAGLGSSLFPSWFPMVQEVSGLAVLTGQDERNIVGSSYANRMHKEVIGPFLQMQEAAANDGIAVTPVSAYRSYQRQKEIFEGKFDTYTARGLSPAEAVAKIIEYSTIPGTSRHHWGTELDLIDAAVPQPESSLEPGNYHGDGAYCRLKEWMDVNSRDFGFYLVYTDNYHRKGFKYEPWHYSYAPVSKPLLAAYMDIDLKAFFRDSTLKGKAVLTGDFLDRYRSENVLDINPKLLP